jgi:hypothetical protein
MPKKLLISLIFGSIATILAPIGLMANFKYGRLDIAWVIIGWQVILNLIAIPLLIQWHKENI